MVKSNGYKFVQGVETTIKRILEKLGASIWAEPIDDYNLNYALDNRALRSMEALMYFLLTIQGMSFKKQFMNKA